MSKRPRPKIPRRRGMALLMVMIVLSTCVIMSYALLQAAVLESAVSREGKCSAAAEYLAESGLQIGAYFLQQPYQSPHISEDGFWTGTGNNPYRIGDGTVAIAIARAPLLDANGATIWIGNPAVAALDFDSYDITATASIVDGTRTVTHTATARVRVRRDVFTSNSTLNFNGTVELSGNNLSLAVQAQAAGTVTLKPPLNLTLLTAPSVIKQGNIALPIIYSSTPLYLPTNRTVNHYLAYEYNGRRYYGQKLNRSTLWFAWYSSSSNNPLGVFWTDDDLDIRGMATINGTLVVMGGNLTISGGWNSVNQSSDLPAIVCDGDIILKRNSGITVNSRPVYVGGQIRGDGSETSGNSSLNISGALYCGGNNGISPQCKSLITITAGVNRAMDFYAAMTATSVNVISWKLAP